LLLLAEKDEEEDVFTVRLFILERSHILEDNVNAQTRLAALHNSGGVS
jgi:hypothetical protein